MNAQGRRKAFRAWKLRALAYLFEGIPLQTITLSRTELVRLPDYSTTIPAGAKPGDRWRADLVVKLALASKAPRDVRPPRWLRRRLRLGTITTLWTLAEVLPEVHPVDGHVIRWSQVRCQRFAPSSAAVPQPTLPPGPRSFRALLQS